MSDAGSSQIVESILDTMVVVGFMFLAMALLSSVLAEVYASLTNRRARMLRAAIEQLLQDKALCDRLYLHPLIQGISKDMRGRSHLDSRLVSLALLDLLPEDDSVTGVLGILRRTCRKNDEDWQLAIEDWFNRAMNRLSRIYEKKTRQGLLAASFCLMAVFNVDTLQLVSGLGRLLPEERQSLTATLAATLNETRPSQIGSPAHQALLDRWQTCDGFACGIAGRHIPTLLPFKQPETILGWLAKGTGWFLSALAASLGSQFWFRLLQLSWRISGRAPLVPPPHRH